MAGRDLDARIDEAAAAVRAITQIVPRVGMVLGSGLGGAALGLHETAVVGYDRIPHLPSPSVAGHGGELTVGKAGKVPVAVLSGRVHLYEGWSVHDVTMGVRTLARLGCEAIVLTNAAGTTRASVRPGALVLITDHLNLTGEDPTRGPEPTALGDRFSNMTDCYDPRLRDLMRRAAEAESITLAEGVYAASKGPCYETPAEVRMLASMGADLVGMSTVPEAIAARHMGVAVAGISCVTNLAAGIEGSRPNHEEVAQIAGEASGRLARLLRRFLELYGG
jgi:purine-nucleoside phosphorylase